MLSCSINRIHFASAHHAIAFGLNAKFHASPMGLPLKAKLVEPGITANVTCSIVFCRALKLTLDTVDKLQTQQIEELAFLAQCAGFDYVSHPDQFTLWTCVKRESKTGTVFVPFIDTYLLAVDLPFSSDDFDYPKELEHELIKPNLFDSLESTKNKLAQNFQVREFKHGSFRYFRLDQKLVICLQNARDYLKKPIHIIKNGGYRPGSVNIINIEDKHPEELYRHNSGQAALIKPNKGTKEEQIQLAKHLMKDCAEDLMLERRGIGLGLREDHLYFDLRPFKAHKSGIFIKLWKVGNKSDDQLSELSQLKGKLETGEYNI